ncbi:hypothetical protein LZ518_12200 [Sphingomonas sp. RB56-2]|uniref:Uncharacterized protein n=1 Tax=Sphingomonas brevis TaxID=2908206 RepID=A0ABT0SBU7_9SPHN|nr:hypothetical protein [Sphingomonas brevis]MCL6741889.1 hypothetical protein [Sphingomonas brevis]
MLSRIATVITAVSLALAAQAPAAAPAKHKNCTAKSHQHAKLAAAKTTKAAKPAVQSGGGVGAQLRRTPDIQILSYGP